MPEPWQARIDQRLRPRPSPQATSSQILPEQITNRHVPGVHSKPMCSLCGKTQRQVKKLIAGPGVYICDECVERLTGAMQYEFPTQDG
jgi:hypothetical protein